MVNVFIVHSSTDETFINSMIKPYLLGEKDLEGKENKGECNCSILSLESFKGEKWKKPTKRKIKMAHVILIVIGNDSAEPRKKETMGWEINQALKYNKQLMVYKINKESTIPGFLYHIDRFTKQNTLIAKEQSLEQIKKRIDDFANGRYKIFSNAYEQMSLEEKLSKKEELIEQYKMFQKSSEDLVVRRQTVNTFYITVNSAIVSLMGVVIGLLPTPIKLYVALFMCVTGIVLDFSWAHLLESYGTLNSAKMKVINLIEEQLPIVLYDAEWRIMSDKLNNKKYVSFTSSEKRIPLIFGIVFSIIIVLLTVYLVVYYVKQH